MSDFLSTPIWYEALAEHTFATQFVALEPEETAALAAGAEEGDAVESAIAKLNLVLNEIRGNSFVSVDRCAPTDTERYELKRGAVYSARSAWVFLARSAKVRESAARGEVSCICARPFRRMSVPREFRIFIKDGKPVAASQYHLVRHFRRLEGVKQQYWELLEQFALKIAPLMPLTDVVADVYVTGAKEVLLIDLNPFGDPTDPLMLDDWSRDWSSIEEPRLRLMPPPFKISGKIKVSF